MAQTNFNHLTHIKNVTAGINKYDPVHKSLFEIYFTLPEVLKQDFAQDEMLLTEQVVSITGLDALHKTPQVGEQKFYGVTVSFSNPMLDTTAADLTCVFNLNLRDVTDNYVLKIFVAWERLSYDMMDGTRTIKVNYISDNMRIAQANRNGQVWRSFIFHHIILTGVTGMDDLDYSSNDPIQLTTTFRSDYWDYDLS